MVTLGWMQDSWSTTLLPHQQPIRRKSHILQSSPQILSSFSGPSDDYPVSPPVWPLFHLQQFQAKLLLLVFRQDCTHSLEKAMAPLSSTLAWKIPWTEEPGRLQSMGSLRVVQDWAPSLSLFTFMHWRRKWQPTPVFLPGESQGRRSLVGCSLWGRTESDTTEVT